MQHTATGLLLELPLLLLTAVGTHLAVSFSQTFLHYRLAHRPLGAKFFRDHINYHHTIYAKDHLVSETHQREPGNLTPFLLNFPSSRSEQVPTSSCRWTSSSCRLPLARPRSTRTSSSTRNITRKDHGLGDLPGSSGSRNFTSCITVMRTAISRLSIFSGIGCSGRLQGPVKSAPNPIATPN